MADGDLPAYGQPIAKIDLSELLAAIQGQVVLSVTGTANQITAAPTTGAVVLSLPSAGTLPGAWHAATGFTVDAGGLTVTAGGITVTDGQVLLSNGTNLLPALAFGAQGSNDGLYYDTTNGNISVAFNGSQQLAIDAGAIRTISAFHLSSGGEFSWGSGSMFTGADLRLARDAANILAQRNGTNLQTFRVYGTYANGGVDYERFEIITQAGDTILRNHAAGTGTTRNMVIGTTGSNSLSLMTGNVSRWQVTTNGHFLALADNSYDIGASGATRPRSMYVGTSVVLPVTAFGTPALTFEGFTADTGINRVNGVLGFMYGGTTSVGIFAGGLQITANGAIGWGGGNPNGAMSTFLYQDASNILAQRNGTSNQIFRLYRTYATAGTDYERFAIDSNAFGAGIGLLLQKGGTGADRPFYLGNETNGALTFRTNATSRWSIQATGHLIADTDNTLDIGASGATRPRNIYVGTGILINGLLNSITNNGGQLDLGSNPLTGVYDIKFVTGARLYPVTGFLHYTTVSSALTRGTAGTMVVPYANMSGAANDAARDALAGNLDGAIAVDSATNVIYARRAGAWFSVS